MIDGDARKCWCAARDFPTSDPSVDDWGSIVATYRHRAVRSVRRLLAARRGPGRRPLGRGRVPRKSLVAVQKSRPDREDAPTLLIARSVRCSRSSRDESGKEFRHSCCVPRPRPSTQSVADGSRSSGERDFDRASALNDERAVARKAGADGACLKDVLGRMVAHRQRGAASAVPHAGRDRARVEILGGTSLRYLNYRRR